MPEADSLVCVLDTGVIVDFLRGRPHTAKLFRHLVREGDLGVSAISHSTILAIARPGTEDLTRSLLDGMTTIDVTAEIARRAGTLLVVSRTDGDDLDLANAIVAATALELDLPLVTDNVERFRVAGLHLVSGRTAVSTV